MPEIPPPAAEIVLQYPRTSEAHHYCAIPAIYLGACGLLCVVDTSNHHLNNCVNSSIYEQLFTYYTLNITEDNFGFRKMGADHEDT